MILTMRSRDLGLSLEVEWEPSRVRGLYRTV